MLIVKIKSGENIDKALKTLKSKVVKTKQNQLLQERKEYVKPSVRRRHILLKSINSERIRKGLK